MLPSSPYKSTVKMEAAGFGLAECTMHLSNGQLAIDYYAVSCTEVRGEGRIPYLNLK